jgi:hypothetical protein
MAQTAQQIVTGALRFLRILDATETPSADDSDNALAHLNDYLNGLNARGAVYPNVTLVISDTVPIPQELEGDLKRALALRCESDWGRAMTPADRAEAMRADRRVVAAHTTLDPAGSDGGLLNMPSQMRRANYQG